MLFLWRTCDVIPLSGPVLLGAGVGQSALQFWSAECGLYVVLDSMLRCVSTSCSTDQTG